MTIPEIDEDHLPRQPLRVMLHGTSMATVDDGTVALSASGHGCLRRLASQLFAVGWDPDTTLVLCRGGEVVGRTTIDNAANRQENDF